MTVSEVLKAAKAPIEDPERWIQRTYALDFDGDEIDPRAALACRFCAMGAIRRAGGFGHDANLARMILENALEAEFDNSYLSVSDFNDNSNHARVMWLFDKAIELAEARQ